MDFADGVHKDPVVREFDVVILKPAVSTEPDEDGVKSSGSTYIVQYPTRIKYHAQQRVDDVTFQPMHEKLETKVCTIAAHTDQGSPFRGINKTTFRSRLIPTRAQYAVGTVRGGRLVLRPVKAVLQMQPVFDYIDNVQVEEESERQETATQARQAAVASQTRILGTSYKVRETNKSRTRKLKSFAYMKSLEDNDVTLPLHIVREAESIGLFTGRVAPEAVRAGEDDDEDKEGDEEEVGGGTKPSTAAVAAAREATLSAEEFCQRMCMYQAVGMSEEDSAVVGTKLSMVALKELSTGEQVAEVLRCGHVVPHADLLHILRQPLKGIPDTKVGRLALDAGHLIQGHWVVRSRVWYKIAYHAACRDYVLRKFQAGEAVTKVALRRLMRDLSPTLLEIMLNEISVFDAPAKEWRFRFPRNDDVQEQFATLAAASSGQLRTIAELTKTIEHGIGAGTVPRGGGHTWGVASGSHASKRRGGGAGGAGAGDAADKRGRGGGGGGGGDGGGAVAQARSNQDLTSAGFAVHRVLQTHAICTREFLDATLATQTEGETFSAADITAALKQLCLVARGQRCACAGGTGGTGGGGGMPPARGCRRVPLPALLWPPRFAATTPLPAQQQHASSLQATHFHSPSPRLLRTT